MLFIIVVPALLECGESTKDVVPSIQRQQNWNQQTKPGEAEDGPVFCSVVGMTFFTRKVFCSDDCCRYIPVSSCRVRVLVVQYPAASLVGSRSCR